MDEWMNEIVIKQWIWVILAPPFLLDTCKIVSRYLMYFTQMPICAGLRDRGLPGAQARAVADVGQMPWGSHQPFPTWALLVYQAPPRGSLLGSSYMVYLGQYWELVFVSEHKKDMSWLTRAWLLPQSSMFKSFLQVWHVLLNYSLTHPPLIFMSYR